MEQLETQERAIRAAKFEVLAEAITIAAAECEFVAERERERQRERERAERRGAGLDAEESAVGGLSGSTDEPGDLEASGAGDTASACFSLPSGRHSELAMRSLRAEFATALRLAESTIERHLDIAIKLASRFPGMLACLRQGKIAEPHVRIMLEAAEVIGIGDTPEVITRRTHYEAAVLEVAAIETPNRLRPIARRLAEKFSEQTIDERHCEARKQRRVYLTDRDDGMADLVAHIPAVEAIAIYNRLMRMAKVVAEAEATNMQAHAESMAGSDNAGSDNAGSGKASGPAAEALGTPPEAGKKPSLTEAQRTRDEIRADLFTDLLTQGEISEQRETSIQAHVQVVVPVDTIDSAEAAEEPGFAKMTGRSGATPRSATQNSSTEPAILAGYGPIGATSARDLASGVAAWEFVKVDSSSGQVLSVNRYRPSEEMRRILRARDQHCRFPGCRAPLSRCDVDHTIDAQFGGPTSLTNLAHLCRGHHTMKHHGGWKVKQDRAGTLTWRSPTGRVHTQHPPSKVAFAPVPPV